MAYKLKPERSGGDSLGSLIHLPSQPKKDESILVSMFSQNQFYNKLKPSLLKIAHKSKAYIYPTKFDWRKI